MQKTEKQMQARITELETTIKLITHASRVVFAEATGDNKAGPISHRAVKILAEAIDRGDAILKERT